ncbi:ATP-binding protein [Mycolicibacterium sp. CR10]|uniref:ATP-binding protein n=1 Tax=Mycolicibacterium sp. CR10 TaxID=2562314 RepID=UPI0010C086A7|nr:ATP-binding protein [Mycolicibacterium sp. CR10]
MTACPDDSALLMSALRAAADNAQSADAEIRLRLDRVRLLLAAEVLAVRAERVDEPPGLAALAVGDAEVDRLLATPPGDARSLPTEAAELIAALHAAADDRRASAEGVGDHGETSLWRLRRAAQLDDVDVDILILAAVPELAPELGRVFAWLHDDRLINEPTVGLALRLLGTAAESPWQLRPWFGPASALGRAGLVSFRGDGPFPRWTFTAPPAVVDVLVGLPRPSGVADGVTLERRPAEVARGAALGADVLDHPLAALYQDDDHDVVVQLDGPAGATLAVAAAIAATTARPLLRVRTPMLATGPEAREPLSLTVAREALLSGAVIVLEEAETMADPAAFAVRQAVAAVAARAQTPVVACASAPFDLAIAVPDVRVVREPVAIPDVERRTAIWRQRLAAVSLVADRADVANVAATFRLGPDAIASAADVAAARCRLVNADGLRPARSVRRADLLAAAREASHHRLDALARRIGAVATWDDIVLPDATVGQLREIAAAVRHRSRVLDEWGFGRSTRGRGLAVLFAGPSGTGKTMAAEVLAGHLGLDLFAVDLASVVSKYVGETEKNLGRIFDEAETSNAILFFDEAEALFGKRSEVRDAHDRYANIEVAYLLQRMEAYEGLAVLATNLADHLDAAFARRLAHIVAFPAPELVLRQRIWTLAFPCSAPTGDLDVEFLAERFEVTGAAIVAAARHAALLAADRGESITTRHVVIALARELQKEGRVPTETQLGDWYAAVFEHMAGRAS